MNTDNHRSLPSTGQLPYALYTAAQVRRFDEIAINQYGIAGKELMGRAGQAAYDLLINSWPDASKILVLTGSGNNGGDGYVVALLALKAGKQVVVVELGNTEKMSPETSFYRQAYLDEGGQLETGKFLSSRIVVDVVVDGILGTGLNTEVKGVWAEAIGKVNALSVPVLALDIPSGINADTGTVMGIAVKADQTISFIGLKQGLFTGAGREFCGDIAFHALDVPATVYASEILSCRRIDWQKMQSYISARSRNAHKGQFGHVLVIGGNHGYSGAVRLCAEAALRSGAGLVSVATRADHAATLNIGRPEIMVHAVESANELVALLERASVVVFGPGAAQDDWARILFKKVIKTTLPLVLDADGLNLLAQTEVGEAGIGVNRILTPHPGEAARLLGCSAVEVEKDRFAAVRQLQQRYQCSVVLKGSGSLICGGGRKPVALCSAGNPGMASGGMGDVLAGILANFMVQNEDADLAACMGVALHAAAADHAAEKGETGMLASDLFESIRALINDID